MHPKMGFAKTMKSKNLIVFVSKGGLVYNRTSGRNDQIQFGVLYSLGIGGHVVFSQEDKQVVVRRYNVHGGEGYKIALATAGMYIITHVYVQPLPKTAKEIRILYNNIKRVFGKANFRVEEKDDLNVPFRIGVHLTNIRGNLESRFVIWIKPNTLTEEVIKEATEIFDEASRVDFSILLSSVPLDNQESLYFTVNKQLFNHIAELNDRNELAVARQA